MTARHLNVALLLFSLFVNIPAPADAGESITPTDAKNHLGERATVCGIVASAKYAVRSRGKPTFLNLGKPYPNQIFTAVVWGDDRSKFSYPSESLDGSSICVSGSIRSYHGTPEIIVRYPADISRPSR